MMIFGMNYRIFYDESIILKKDKIKVFKDTKNALKIKNKLEFLAKNPFDVQLNIKLLKPKSAKKFRLRIGDYRVIYSIDTGNKIIIIHRIAKRKDIYRNN